MRLDPITLIWTSPASKIESSVMPKGTQSKLTRLYEFASLLGCSTHSQAAKQPVQPDDHSEVVPLLPIPNRTVKRLSADDSAHSRVKVGHRQATPQMPPPACPLGAASLLRVPFAGPLAGPLDACRQPFEAASPLRGHPPRCDCLATKVGCCTAFSSKCRMDYSTSASATITAVG